MDSEQADRIAAAVNMLRPDWPTRSIRKLLDRPTLAGRPLRDVAVALTWVACDPGSATPARVTTAGPWWTAAAAAADPRIAEGRGLTMDQGCHCGRPLHPADADCRDPGRYRHTPVNLAANAQHRAAYLAAMERTKDAEDETWTYDESHPAGVRETWGYKSDGFVDTE